MVYIVLSLLLYIMFHQNSNDLVKNASVKSGHVQNSKETQELMTSQVTFIKDNNKRVNFIEDDANRGYDNSSLSIGAQFQQMIQGLINGFSIKEGIDGAGGVLLLQRTHPPVLVVMVRPVKPILLTAKLLKIKNIRNKS